MGIRFDVTIRAYRTHFPFKEEITTGTHRFVFLNGDIEPSDAKRIATDVIRKAELSLYEEGVKCLNQSLTNSIRVKRVKKGPVKRLVTTKKTSCEDGENGNGSM